MNGCTALVKTPQGMRPCEKDVVRRGLCSGHVVARKLYKAQQTKHQAPERALPPPQSRTDEQKAQRGVELH